MPWNGEELIMSKKGKLFDCEHRPTNRVTVPIAPVSFAQSCKIICEDFHNFSGISEETYLACLKLKVGI